MNVRNRIATFEVRNEEVRHQLTSAPDTPPSSSTGGPSSSSLHNNNNNMVVGSGSMSMPSSRNGTQQQHQHQLLSHHNLHRHHSDNSSMPNNNSGGNTPLEDEGKPPSTTSLASQSRIQRLRNSHGIAANINNNNASSVTPTSSVVRKNDMTSAARLLGIPAAAAGGNNGDSAAGGARLVSSSSPSRSSSGGRSNEGNNNNGGGTETAHPSASLFSHPKQRGQKSGGRDSQQQQQQQQHDEMEDPGKIMSSATQRRDGGSSSSRNRLRGPSPGAGQDQPRPSSRQSQQQQQSGRPHLGSQRMQKIQRMQKNRSIERVRRRQQLGRSYNHPNNSDAASIGTATTASSSGTAAKRQQQQQEQNAAAAAQHRSGSRGYPSPSSQQMQQQQYPGAQQQPQNHSYNSARARHAQQPQQHSQQHQQHQQQYSGHGQSHFENTHEDFSQRTGAMASQPYHHQQHNQHHQQQQPDASADYDEEMTLTSVRQIVGTSAAQQQQQQQQQQYGGHNPNLQSNHHHQQSLQQQQQQMLHHASSSMDHSNAGRRKQGYPMGATSGDMATRRWMGEEKKTDKGGGGGVLLSRSSSSDYETAGYETDGERQVRQVPTSTSQATPDVASFFEQSQRRKAHERLRKDAAGLDNGGEPSFDYAFGDRDEDGSQVSLSYEQRRQKEISEQQTREQAVAAAKAEMDGPFVRKDDVEQFQNVIDTPIAQTAAGVVVAATVGCIIMGPMGLLVGAAAVGIGVGVMQIPEEQRNNMNAKAGKALKGVSETALLASESISNSCANTYKDSGFAEHVPVDVQSCCTGMEETMTGGKKHNNGGSMDKDQIQIVGSEDRAQLGGGGGDFMGGGGGAKEGQRSPDDVHPRQAEKRGGVACLREGAIIPVNQIYSLAPTDQPRAWLDVLASAETSYDEKMEAMEEILILAKDKTRARILVEEGILDSIMWTLSRYFEKVNFSSTEWAHPEITTEEAKAAKLSAACCLRLGKAYCAAIHTEGDLMLMSLYERGTVPEERQLAQMLHEVPYHARVTKTNDPTLVDPSKEVFALQKMSLPQAEEFARSIKALADGPLNNP